MRNEYPRMDRKRENYQMLVGKWNFMFDEDNIGEIEKWYKQFPQNHLNIIVPYAYQAKLSGIDDQRRCDVVWYQRSVEVKEGHSELIFGAVDYICDVYIDGEHKINHVGGETTFKIGLYYEKETTLNIILRVEDPSYDEEIPRGKQIWEKESKGIWYTPTTGIWQPVWIDYVGEAKVQKVKTKSNIVTGIQEFRIEVNNKALNKQLKLDIYFEGNSIYSGGQEITNENIIFCIDKYNKMIFKTPFHGGGQESICWSPEHPRLFDYVITIMEGEELLDRLEGYYGFREIKIQDGMTYLNNNPYYFKLVLDQGYWKNGLLTAPRDEDFIKDIELAKEMGFNGCRKHQKVEDPRFLYWADKLGFLVWGEVASAPVFTEKAVKNTQTQWFDIIERDYNHPSIVAWVPLNESWGVPFINVCEMQQAHSMSLYYMLKSIDSTRLVISNDGWEMTKSDVCAIHNYNHGNIEDKRAHKFFEESMSTKQKLLASRSAGKPIYAGTYKHDEKTPIMITEFGGIAYDSKNPKGWGYTAVTNSSDLISEYKRIITTFGESECIFGYCYTQLCDVEQEVNGFLTYDREPKCDLGELKTINDKMNYRY